MKNEDDELKSFHVHFIATDSQRAEFEKLVPIDDPYHAFLEVLGALLDAQKDRKDKNAPKSL